MPEIVAAARGGSVRQARAAAGLGDDPGLPAHAVPAAAGHGASGPQKLYLQGANLLAGERTADAISVLERCIVLDPSFAKCYRSLGLAYSQGGADDIAVAYYEKYLTLVPEAVDAPVVRHMIQAALQASHGSLETTE